MSSRITPGSRLRSQVCAGEVVVVRAGTGRVDLTCGGLPMVPLGAGPAATATARPASGLMTGTALGKRYVAGRDDTFEVLVTRPGDGTLADGADPLLLKAARPLPASD